MGNPGAQHEMVCTLVHKYPKLALRLADIAGVKFPVHDLEDVLQQDMFERLRELQAFREYEARVVASAKASAEAEADAALAAAAAKARAEAKADDLTQFFFLRGDKLQEHAFSQINGCKDVSKLSYWLHRAYSGETPEEIFPEPEAPGR